MSRGAAKLGAPRVGAGVQVGLLVLDLLGFAGIFACLREIASMLEGVAAQHPTLVVAVGAGPSLFAAVFPLLHTLLILRQRCPETLVPRRGGRILAYGGGGVLILSVLTTFFLLDYPEFRGYRDCGQVPGMHTRLALHHGFALGETACPRG